MLSGDVPHKMVQEGKRNEKILDTWTMRARAHTEKYTARKNRQLFPKVRARIPKSFKIKRSTELLEVGYGVWRHFQLYLQL